ncbi:carboxylesterase family protein [Novosphingobium sp. FGD1]|jgi:para-nitrobenzyl esterase|uniref:Carboxylic ester hydrolase n=1 Tax=Novosphingobium silvae TaxID=2692619 RepID=A0A7X4GIM2_9SPHN|nr:carboxylesterase family protein [Novosphingobium silvae]MYL98249.1 carboxylesterase family protein [Novosphingobium silvae]
MQRFSAFLAMAATCLAISGCTSGLGAPPVARTGNGMVSGVADHGVVSWKGIPFAAPPVGDLRWRAPQPLPAWEGTRTAERYGSDCMQKPFGGDAAPLGMPPSEDCLYLNVWKPEGERRKLPVIVWIYGGGFLNGGASPATYSGAELARKGVMVVSFNYRVGRFGTFAHPQLSRSNADGGLLGNYGTLDQVAALNWVHDNIAAFGGDPGNVTVMGESAGGMSVHMLLTSPLTQGKGLIHRAIIMSGGNGGGMGGGGSLAEAEKTGTAFAATKGIAPDAPDALARLRALSPEQVVDGLNLETLFSGRKAPYSSPFPDGRIVVDPLRAYAAGKFVKVPVMAGATSADIGGPEGPMIKGARDVSRALTAAGVPVYAYRFSYVASGAKNGQGAAHATDIPFFFDTQAVKYGDSTTARDNHLGKLASDAVIAFATTGDPNGGRLPAWPRYDPAKDMILDFAADGDAHVGRDPLTAR